MEEKNKTSPPLKAIGRKIKLIKVQSSEEFKTSNKYYELDVQTFLDHVSHFIKLTY